MRPRAEQPHLDHRWRRPRVPYKARAAALINIDIDHFRARVLQDALTEATAAYWLRRAQAFRHAAPKRRDYPGQASLLDLAAASRRCLDIAKACERQAQLLLSGRPEPISDEVLSALEEVA
jgi:hypothetical protein